MTLTETRLGVAVGSTGPVALAYTPLGAKT